MIDNGIKRETFEIIFSNLKGEAEPWRTTWRDLQTFINPVSGNFDDQINVSKEINHKRYIDGTSRMAVRTFASGMTSGLTSPSRPWFNLGFTDPGLSNYAPAKLWIDECERRMYYVLAKTGIYKNFTKLYSEIGTYAHAALAILEDRRRVITGHSFTCGEFYFGINYNGEVDTFVRRFPKKIRNLIAEYGEDNVTEQTRQLYQDPKKRDQHVWIINVITPNINRDADKIDNRNMPFIEVYWEESSKSEDEYLRIAGYEEFPILTPRWETVVTSDAYGVGPGLDALGDSKMLQKMQIDKLISIEKTHNPPVQVSGEVDGPINTVPGGVSRTSLTHRDAGVKPVYQISPDLRSLEYAIQETRNMIKEYFYYDLFLMLKNIDRSNVTATEIAEKQGEKLLQLGPVLENLKGEQLDPFIERLFNIMFRKRLLPQPPTELQGREMRVEYISILAQAQKEVGTRAIEHSLGFVGSAIEIYPEVRDNFNIDEAFRLHCDLNGTPMKLLRSNDEIAQIRKQREQQIQQQAEAEQRVRQIQEAKIMSDTKMGQNSALDAVSEGSAA